MIEELQSFGLSEKEAKVYFASLELGRATADQLAKKAEIVRSTTYVQIEELMRLGLMTTYQEGKKTYFTAESPEYLKRIFERKRQELDLQEKHLNAVIPSLTNVFKAAGERPVVRFFEGKEGIVTMRNEVLKTNDKNIYMAFSFDDLWSLFEKDELYAWSNERARKNIHSTILYTKTGEDVSPVQPQRLVRVSKEDYPFECDIYIFDSKVAMASLKGTIVGVIIESKAISKSMLSIFKLALKAAESKSK